jgi:putative DNA primase/helicase
MALWVVHTHAFAAAEIAPRLAFTSPENRCGKTTALKILRRLVQRPLPTSNLSPAVLFRAIDLVRASDNASPTLLIDEADTFLSDDG